MHSSNMQAAAAAAAARCAAALVVSLLSLPLCCLRSVLRPREPRRLWLHQLGLDGGHQAVGLSR